MEKGTKEGHVRKWQNKINKSEGETREGKKEVGDEEAISLRKISSQWRR